MTNRDREYNAFTPKTLGVNRIELVDAETPRRAAEFPGESTSRRGQCRPPDPQLRYLRNQVGGTCGFWQSLAVFVQLLQTRLFWTLLRL